MRNYTRQFKIGKFSNDLSLALKNAALNLTILLEFMIMIIQVEG